MQADLVLDARADLAEGPMWDASAGCLWWVDIPAGTVHRLDPATGRDEWFDAGEPVGAVMLRRSGGLVMATATGLVTGDVRGRELRTLHEVDTNPPGGRFNDGKADRWGRVWAGTLLPRATGAGALYRLDADGSLHTMVTGVSLSNGLDWSPDGLLMYYIDTPTFGVDVFDHEPETGQLTNRRRLIDIDGALPDGMTVDCEGGIWVALVGGHAVERYGPDGVFDRTVRVPAHSVTSCAFGGPDLATLYVTTARRGRSAAELAGQPHAGGIFACDPGVRGRPPGQWWG